MSTTAEAPLPEGWVEKMDEKTKKPYFYNKTTKETSWKRPKPDPNALPEGWVEKKDDKTGKSYYYNKATKETSWKRPGAAASPSPAPAADPNALPEGWVEKDDPKSGKKYYYNKTTKETSWTRPGGSPTPTAADPNALPEGWVEKDDPKSGKKYYYNKTTKETSWTRPGGGAATPAAGTPSEKENAGPSPAAEEEAVPKEKKKQPKWVPPPAPSSFPPPPPSSRHPKAMLGAGGGGQTPEGGGSSRSSSHLSSNDSSAKSNGWRNLSKAQWLEELERRMGGSTHASRQQLLQNQSGGGGGGGGVSSSGAQSSSSTSRDLTEREIARLTAQGVTVSAQETLQDLSRKDTVATSTSTSTSPNKGQQSFVDFRDGATQTVFGPPTADVGVATLHAASNIAELVPLPDAGILSCATLESLRREQEKALSLLQHVQGTLASQMQEAGVAFAGQGNTRQLRLNIAKKPASNAKGEENETAALVKELGPAYRSLHAPASTGPHWRFATEHDSNSLYDDVAMKRAHVVEQLAEKTQQRHELFDRIEDDFKDNYDLREKMWAEYSRVNANSLVDVADYVLHMQHEQQTKRAAAAAGKESLGGRHRHHHDDD